MTKREVVVHVVLIIAACIVCFASIALLAGY
jgi:multisubunit Na+/H+ antiporter MnhG subunit